MNSAYEELKHRLDIWTGEGSGWIKDRIEDMYIDVAIRYVLWSSSRK